MSIEGSGERVGEVLIRGMYKEIVAKGKHIGGRKGNGCESLFKTNSWRLGLPEAGGLLNSRDAGR